MSLLDLPEYDPDSWDLQAGCRGADPADLTPDHPRLEYVQRVARVFCGPCPVRDECLARAADAPWRSYGIWGGRWLPGALAGTLRPELRAELDLLEPVSA